MHLWHCIILLQDSIPAGVLRSLNTSPNPPFTVKALIWLPWRVHALFHTHINDWSFCIYCTGINVIMKAKDKLVTANWKQTLIRGPSSHGLTFRYIRAVLRSVAITQQIYINRMSCIKFHWKPGNNSYQWWILMS